MPTMGRCRTPWGLGRSRHVAEFVAVQEREVVRSKNAFAFARQFIHGFRIARCGRECRAIYQRPHIRGDKRSLAHR